MNINFEDIPSPSTLITTMDKHPVGAALFVVVLLILSVALVACCWMYFNYAG
jgi:hypothetical protein